MDYPIFRKQMERTKAIGIDWNLSETAFNVRRVQRYNASCLICHGKDAVIKRCTAICGYHICSDLSKCKQTDESIKLNAIKNHSDICAELNSLLKGRCLYCGSGSNIKACSGCKEVHYCSKECQRDDWKIHKKDCK